MVERTKKENDVSGRIGESGAPRVSDLTGSKGPRVGGVSPLRFVDETRDRIQQVNRIACLGQPKGVSSGRATNVQNRGGRGGDVALDQFARAEGLKQECALFETMLLKRSAIIVCNSWIEFRR